MITVKYIGYIISHGGNIRANNEDNAYLAGYYRKNDNEFSWKYEIEKNTDILASVFDGMGGEEDGEVASRIAAEVMCGMKYERFSDMTEEYAKNASDRVQDYGKETHIGTTYVAVSVEEDVYYFSNIGDSRGYLLRDGKLTQMTKDHNMVQELLKAGILTFEQAKKHPDRHTLYQYLGMKEEDNLSPEPYLSEPIKAKEDDICLLCSDGLTDMMTEMEIRDILVTDKSLNVKAEELMQSSLTNGGKDNITILLLKCCK